MYRCTSARICGYIIIYVRKDIIIYMYVHIIVMLYLFLCSFINTHCTWYLTEIELNTAIIG